MKQGISPVPALGEDGVRWVESRPGAEAFQMPSLGSRQLAHIYGSRVIRPSVARLLTKPFLDRVPDPSASRLLSQGIGGESAALPGRLRYALISVASTRSSRTSASRAAGAHRSFRVRVTGT